MILPRSVWEPCQLVELGMEDPRLAVGVGLVVLPDAE